MTGPAAGSAAWTADELDLLGGIGEIDIATRRRDGSLRPKRIVWVVRHADAVYVRSVNGVDAAWYRGVESRHDGHLTAGWLHSDVAFVAAGDDGGLDETLDEAYRVKYGRASDPVARITAPAARATTLRIDPA